MSGTVRELHCTKHPARSLESVTKGSGNPNNAPCDAEAYPHRTGKNDLLGNAIKLDAHASQVYRGNFKPTQSNVDTKAEDTLKNSVLMKELLARIMEDALGECQICSAITTPTLIGGVCSSLFMSCLLCS